MIGGKAFYGSTAEPGVLFPLDQKS